MSNLTNFSDISLRYLQENHSPKLISLTASSFLTIFCVPLFYSFIWYEHFGSDKKRTLINQLVAYIWKIVIFYLVVARFCDTVNSIFGPFSEWMCFILWIIKGACTAAVLITINAVMLTRYIYIFHYKNPGRVDDDFWITFLSMWISGVSLISYCIWYCLPGMQPIYFYICKGDFKATEQVLPYKSRLALILLGIGSVLINAVILCRIKIYKWKAKEHINAVASNNSPLLDKSLLTNLLLCCFVLCIVLAVSIFGYISNKYFQPNAYQIPSYNLFWFQNSLVSIELALIGVVVLVKRKDMQTLIASEFKIMFNNYNSIIM
jgi:hypothetical protein